MVIHIFNDAAYNAYTEPLFKSCGILPLKHLCDYFKVQFMQKFTQGFLPSSFDDVWISNKIRRAGQDQVELRNNDDINILWIPIYNYLYQKFIYVSISKLRR